MFTAINHSKNENFQVVWDLGRRCTYACSYCGPHHSNKTSPLIDIEKLKNTLDGLVEYAMLLNKYRIEEKITSISFTGGEPTIHPDFFPFIEHLKEKYPLLRTHVTTNGCYNDKKCKKIINNMDSAAISYHPEASVKEKELVLDNIQRMVDANFSVSVNVMFHKDYFEECKNVCRYCKTLGIKYTPRPIGDSNNHTDVIDGTAHTYSSKQLNYIHQGWKTDVMAMVPKTSIETIGRPCCNGKCLSVKIDNKWKKQLYVPSTNFFNWSCMVNWDFLFINSEFDTVYFHQTCKVNLNSEIGPIGKASNFKKIINEYTNMFNDGTVPVIRCPKTHCGCGLCSPKAKEKFEAENIFAEKVNGLEPKFIDSFSERCYNNL